MLRRAITTSCLLWLGLATASAAGAGFDPRAHDDLSEVILLCATEPGSSKFDAVWVGWVRNNPTADVEAAIGTVVSRAGTVRSMAIPGIAPTKPGSRPDPTAIAEHMRALAGRAATSG